VPHKSGYPKSKPVATKAAARAATAPKASARARAVASPNARFNRPAGPPTRPKKVVPKPKALAPKAAQPGFDLGKTLDQLNPFRKMGSGIGDAMHTGDNQVKKILRK